MAQYMWFTYFTHVVVIIQDTDKVPNTNVESNKDIKIYLTKTKWQQGNRGMDGQYRSENHKVEGKWLFDNSK